MPSNAGLYAPRDSRLCHEHTSCPIEDHDYLGWHAWAEKMAKTHKQIKCKGCGKWKIWILKKRTASEQQEQDGE